MKNKRIGGMGGGSINKPDPIKPKMKKLPKGMKGKKVVPKQM